MAPGALSQRKKASLATAKAVPALLAAIVVYASYVIVGPLSIEYLINGENQRIATGLAITIVWFVLLIPVVATWLRLLYVVFRNPGYVPQGASMKPADGPSEPEPPGLGDFYSRDVFVCDPQGFPIWCQFCHCWKPDRAHHNQDTGRCTMKMDHFCPWVGGVVGERALKFFMQFLFYSMVLSTYAMVVLAYFISETKADVQWIVALALAAFFVLFAGGMVLNTMQMIFKNVTTIEHINPFKRTMLLAVLLPPELQSPWALANPGSVARTSPSRSEDGESSDRPLTSELNDPTHQTYFSNERPQKPKRSLSRSKHWKGTVTYPLSIPSDRPPLPAPPTRTFAILETTQGMNPWDLGTPFRNFKAIFGEKPHHWLLPVRHSPCCDHSSLVSQYPLGHQFEQLLIDAGLTQYSEWNDSAITKVSRAGRKRTRKLDEGWKNGERPDGWPMEKEARKSRRQSRKRTREEKNSVVR